MMDGPIRIINTCMFLQVILTVVFIFPEAVILRLKTNQEGS